METLYAVTEETPKHYLQMNQAERLDLVRRANAQKEKNKFIAGPHGVSSTLFWKWNKMYWKAVNLRKPLEELKFPDKLPKKQNRTTESMRAGILEGLRQGRSQKEMCKLYNLSKSAVSKVYIDSLRPKPEPVRDLEQEAEFSRILNEVRLERDKLERELAGLREFVSKLESLIVKQMLECVPF